MHFDIHRRAANADGCVLGAYFSLGLLLRVKHTMHAAHGNVGRAKKQIIRLPVEIDLRLGVQQKCRFAQTHRGLPFAGCHIDLALGEFLKLGRAAYNLNAVFFGPNQPARKRQRAPKTQSLNSWPHAAGCSDRAISRAVETWRTIFGVHRQFICRARDLVIYPARF